MMKRVMIVAPHPDDETLGCGGTILKLKKQKKEIYWVIVTNISVKQGFSPRKVDTRQNEIEKVAKFYGFDNVYKLDYPTAMLEAISVKDIIDRFSSVINKIKPDSIFIPYQNDIHFDHRITSQAVISCTKTFRTPFIKRLSMYEVISETEFGSSVFVPNSFCDITDYTDKKIKAMKIYKGEMGKHPFPRSEEAIMAQAVLRGATAGYKHAEAFHLLKEIW
ncbi:MAG: PIG-L family deacetylase [Candidatus Omnitrophica bacterium]|nr:PIG-L family deacetylase [Candidatus Omnitrophota bacterium]